MKLKDIIYMPAKLGDVVVVVDVVVLAVVFVDEVSIREE